MSRLDAKIDRIEAQLEGILNAQIALDARQAKKQLGWRMFYDVGECDYCGQMLSLDRERHCESCATLLDAEQREEAQLAAEDTDRIIGQERYHS